MKKSLTYRDENDVVRVASQSVATGKKVIGRNGARLIKPEDKGETVPATRETLAARLNDLQPTRQATTATTRKAIKPRVQISVEIDEEEGAVYITLPLNPPNTLSSTAKTFVLATTNGNPSVGQTDDGDEIFLGVNMYRFIRPDEITNDILFARQVAAQKKSNGR